MQATSGVVQPVGECIGQAVTLQAACPVMRQLRPWHEMYQLHSPPDAGRCPSGADQTRALLACGAASCMQLGGMWLRR
jgi:hypothetical protein